MNGFHTILSSSFSLSFFSSLLSLFSPQLPTLPLILSTLLFPLPTLVFFRFYSLLTLHSFPSPSSLHLLQNSNSIHRAPTLMFRHSKPLWRSTTTASSGLTIRRPWLNTTSSNTTNARRLLSAIPQPLQDPLTSFVQGETLNARPLSESTLGQFWDDNISKHGDRLGLVVKHEEDLHWTFRQFGEEVDRLCRGLYDSGLRKGDRLA